MKLTPSSTARRKTFLAFSRSGGQPQIPSPVNRIAPNPNRLTKRSSPNKNVSSLLLVLVAARSFGNPPVKTPAAPAEIAPKNVLRFIASKYVAAIDSQLRKGAWLQRSFTLSPVRQETNPPWSVAPKRTKTDQLSLLRLTSASPHLISGI